MTKDPDELVSLSIQLARSLKVRLAVQAMKETQDLGEQTSMSEITRKALEAYLDGVPSE